MSDNKIRIKKGSIQLEADRKQLIIIDETSDGVSFHFKPDIRLNFNDIHMPNDCKIKIRSTDLTFENADLEFDLDNYKVPVVVNFE